MKERAIEKEKERGRERQKETEMDEQRETKTELEQITAQETRNSFPCSQERILLGFLKPWLNLDLVHSCLCSSHQKKPELPAEATACSISSTSCPSSLSTKLPQTDPYDFK